MWKAIEWYAQNGYKQITFGIVEPQNGGHFKFKRGWSGKEEIINYYKYDIMRGVFVNGNSDTKSLYNFF